MDEARVAYRDALAAHHRRVLRVVVPGQVAVWSLVGLTRGRDAWARRDRLALAALAFSGGSMAFAQVVNYRRAGRRADEDLAAKAKKQEHARRVAAQTEHTKHGVRVPLAALTPPDRSTVGCLTPLALSTAGWVQAMWDFRHRPGRANSAAAGLRWVWRPGPAWWTGWSWQQLPVNAASTAPRAAQVAYQRRQLLTTGVTGLAAEAVTVFETQARPAWAAREWPRLAAGVLRLSARALNLAVDYRRVPTRVDTQRARRRRHDTLVAELRRDHTAGRPRPTNPYRVEMALSAACVATAAASFATGWHLQARHRPKPPIPPRPKPPTSRPPPRAA